MTLPEGGRLGVRMGRMTSLTAMAGMALTVACHSAPPDEKPVPLPTLVELSHPRPDQDSAAMAPRAAADSIERARQVGLDGLAREVANRQLRLAEQTVVDRAAFVAAEKSAELEAELGVMVHFDVSSATLLPAGRMALDRKVAILNSNPSVRLRIAGASDERGSVRFNRALGNRRAVAVMQYLVGKGIDPARLDQVTLGEKSPLDSGSGETTWARNRRVEFVIVSGDMPLALK